MLAAGLTCKVPSMLAAGLTWQLPFTSCRAAAGGEPAGVKQLHLPLHFLHFAGRYLVTVFDKLFALLPSSGGKLLLLSNFFTGN
jgi:hypothetical protein